MNTVNKFSAGNKVQHRITEDKFIIVEVIPSGILDQTYYAVSILNKVSGLYERQIFTEYELESCK